MIQWFKKNPQFLREESAKLSNDSNYKELYQCRDNLFISYGDILVRLDKLYRYPILVVYSNATPYQLPAIFPLKRNLTKDEMEDFAASNTFELYNKVKPLVLFYYRLRHQNSSGELCVLERENLEDDDSFYGITTILKRVRDWHAAHTTKKYPPDSEEVDFCSHFNFINQEMKLLYSQQFLNEELTEGDCYARRFKYIPASKFIKEDKRIYWGCFIDGVNKSGLIETTNINLEKHFLDERIKNSLDLINKPAVVKELTNSGHLLKVQWFHTDKEPVPFEKLNDLIAIIGNGDYDKGIQRIMARCKETFRQIENFFFIALRFPNRKEVLEFQLFKVYRSATPPEYILQSNERDKIIEMLKQYERVEAIRGEKVTEQTFHQRNSKRADYEILKKACLNIFGVGAIGSEIADCMAKAGTGNIALFDDQRLNVHNAVRHLAGTDMTDEFKVEAVAEIIQNHNPFVIILPAPLNLFYYDFNELIADDSLTVSSIADDYVEGFVNQQMVISNRQAFYIRALRGGKVARVFRVIPGKDACFHCLGLYRQQKKDFIDIPDDPDYPTLKNECNNPIRPASAADLKFTAAFTSRILIDHIQNGESTSNHWIWTSEKIDDTPLQAANQIYQQHIPPHPQCTYCNHEKKINLTIPKNVLQFMQALVKENPIIETGGVLAGYVDEDGNVTISHASGPGPKAMRSAVKFEKDVEYCQGVLDKLFVESIRKTVYIGEWHSHPSKNNNPSGRDIKSLSEIAVQKEYLTDSPAMVIFSNKGIPSCTIHPAGKRYYFTELNIK
jgi:integrative and conjugative element protein (TIGR02256 family)